MSYIYVLEDIKSTSDQNLKEKDIILKDQGMCFHRYLGYFPATGYRKFYMSPTGAKFKAEAVAHTMEEAVEIINENYGLSIAAGKMGYRIFMYDIIDNPFKMDLISIQGIRSKMTPEEFKFGHFFVTKDANRYNVGIYAKTKIEAETRAQANWKAWKEGVDI